ncbi:SCO family protein [Salinisphaera aquimarina]|uniref:SCO family protein n=1 Tax=Salinisphaera aquimarina TaxID=2094031 RepID=A0ABV7EL21_9GAMM
MIQPSLFSFLRAAVLGLALVLSGCGSDTPDYTAHDIQGVMPNLAFNLTDENGKKVDADDYAGDLRLLFFGYTNCPDICPATMARIRAALGGLDEAQRDKVDVLFVSVDPKRDSLERIRQFTSSFGPDFVGLTGSQEQLRALSKRYRVTYGYGEPNDHGFYLVSHSSAIFAFDSQGRARLLANQSETIDQLSADLKTLLAHQDDPKG